MPNLKCNLVPRPFSPPVFEMDDSRSHDHFQCTGDGGEQN